MEQRDFSSLVVQKVLEIRKEKDSRKLLKGIILLNDLLNSQEKILNSAMNADWKETVRLARSLEIAADELYNLLQGEERVE